MEKTNRTESREPNRAIACTVDACAHHAKTCDYCVLDRIHVGTHEPHPTETKCVDCESFACESASCGKANSVR